MAGRLRPPYTGQLPWWQYLGYCPCQTWTDPPGTCQGLSTNFYLGPSSRLSSGPAVRDTEQYKVSKVYECLDFRKPLGHWFTLSWKLINTSAKGYDLCMLTWSIKAGTKLDSLVCWRSPYLSATDTIMTLHCATKWMKNAFVEVFMERHTKSLNYLGFLVRQNDQKPSNTDQYRHMR